jgi:hypothetical protein
MLQQFHLLVLRDCTGELSHPPRQQASPVPLPSSDLDASPIDSSFWSVLFLADLRSLVRRWERRILTKRAGTLSPPESTLDGHSPSGRCLSAWTFLAAVADSPDFLTELTSAH